MSWGILLVVEPDSDPADLSVEPQPAAKVEVPSERLDALLAACRSLIKTRFAPGADEGAAGVVLDDRSILTGTAPAAINPSVQVCHETEPYCAAYRLDRRIVASACVHHRTDGAFVVLSPCGVCRERLAVYGPEVLIATADPADAQTVRWIRLGDALPHYWMTAFPAEVDPAWISDAGRYRTDRGRSPGWPSGPDRGPSGS